MVEMIGSERRVNSALDVHVLHGTCTGVQDIMLKHTICRQKNNIQQVIQPAPGLIWGFYVPELKLNSY